MRGVKDLLMIGLAIQKTASGYFEGLVQIGEQNLGEREGILKEVFNRTEKRKEKALDRYNSVTRRVMNKCRAADGDKIKSLKKEIRTLEREINSFKATENGNGEKKFTSAAGQ